MICGKSQGDWWAEREWCHREVGGGVRLASAVRTSGFQSQSSCYPASRDLERGTHYSGSVFFICKMRIRQLGFVYRVVCTYVAH